MQDGAGRAQRVQKLRALFRGQTRFDYHRAVVIDVRLKISIRVSRVVGATLIGTLEPSICTDELFDVMDGTRLRNRKQHVLVVRRRYARQGPHLAIAERASTHGVRDLR